MSRLTSIAVAVFVLLALAAPGASAATRYAAPGGAETGPCTDPQHPCTIYEAAGATPGVAQPGDEVVLAPGEYSDTAGDLGSPEFVQLAPEIEVRGEADKPRPRIVLASGTAPPGFVVEEEDLLADVEVVTSSARSDIEVEGGIVEDLIARNTSTTQPSIDCVQVAGMIRNSACLSSAPHGAAVGDSSATPITSTDMLRNVTAVSTGSEGTGLSYSHFGPGAVTVSAKSVIAKGHIDVAAEAIGLPEHEPGTGGEVTIDLDHSDYASVAETSDVAAGGVASITGPSASEGFNVEAPPSLAADGYHELAGSPTIDAGATDISSAATDIDGQNRSIGKPDIGADEYIHPTSLALSCTPEEVILTDAMPHGGTTCRATVTDEAETPQPFSGQVVFSTGAGGTFEASSCVLPGSSEAATSCQVNYLPERGSVGTHAIAASFAGDADHEGSQGEDSVTVTELPHEACAFSSTSCSGGGGPPAPKASRPMVRIVKKPAKKTSGRSAKFTFVTGDDGVGFECKLDKKPFRPCRSPYGKKVKRGRHRFAVRAVGAGGLRSGPATYRWRVVRPARR
jgi:hypothetical protein